MIASGNREEAVKIRAEWVHCLGNLTLSGYNSKLSNLSFTKKQAKSVANVFGTPINIGYKNGLALNNIESWKNTISNDFEKTIFPLFPQLQTIKENLYEMGALYAAMSGSGSTMFGLFAAEPSEEFFQNKNFTTKVVKF